MTRQLVQRILSGILLISLPALASDAELYPRLRQAPAMEESPDTQSAYSIDELRGHFDPAEHPAFVRVPEAYASKKNMYLRKEALEAFLRMRRAARQAGFRLTILSATRNFDYQKTIWENKWTGKTLVQGKNLAQTLPDAPARALKIMHYSAMPGTSRHHWGTDMDINALENDYFESGNGKKLYAWLQAHAAEFGFCQPYTAKGSSRMQGYEEEKWHWSYMPLARPMLKSYTEKILPTHISGFLGDQSVAEIDVIGRYVCGIDTSCL